MSSSEEGEWGARKKKQESSDSSSSEEEERIRKKKSKKKKKSRKYDSDDSRENRRGKRRSKRKSKYDSSSEDSDEDRSRRNRRREKKRRSSSSGSDHRSKRRSKRRQRRRGDDSNSSDDEKHAYDNRYKRSSGRRRKSRHGASSDEEQHRYVRSVRKSRRSTSGGRGGGYGGGRGDRQEFDDRDDRYGEDFGNLEQVDWHSKKLEKRTTGYYEETEAVKRMSTKEAKAFRESLGITVKASKHKDIPKPVRTFEEAGFPSFILKEIEEAGFKKPTPIQTQAWPMIHTGRDVLGIADTGSGKTLAFTLPALVHIMAQPKLQRGDGPIALILSPTRELCMQTYDECSRFGHTKGIKCCAVYGGSPKREQAYKLKDGVHMVVATPGRLIDFLGQYTTNLERVTYLVLDEADRMLDMGFGHQLRTIIQQVRPDHQTLFFTATWPKSVYQTAKEYCDDPLSVLIGSTQTHACANVKQTFDFCDGYQKRDIFLSEVVPKVCGKKVLVFANTKVTVDWLTRAIRQNGYKSISIHGDKTQFERNDALKRFKKGEVEFLVATDVAQRGLDIKGIEYVVNYDVPSNVEDYVHRIGRTARAGAKGIALTLFTPEDEGHARNYISVLKEADQKVPKILAEMGSNRFTGLPRREVKKPKRKKQKESRRTYDSDSDLENTRKAFANMSGGDSDIDDV